MINELLGALGNQWNSSMGVKESHGARGPDKAGRVVKMMIHKKEI